MPILHRLWKSWRYAKITLAFVVLSFVNMEKIKYFQPRTILMEPYSTLEYSVAVEDSISDTAILYKVSSKEGFPIYFYRELFTPVCFDNKCRPLTIRLYWNVTGRYLGFELPEGEFLSKTDHDPFTTEEYEKLNGILANESTPLASIDYNQLTVDANSHGLDDIDGIASATPQNLAPYVINGAAYTTYKLWHEINGPMKRKVQDLTIDDLSPALVLKILKSPVLVDKIWALERIDGYVEFTTELKEQVFELMKDDNYIIVEKALNAINVNELDSDNVQQRLMETLVHENYNIQIRVIEKIADCDALKTSVTMGLVENLGDLNGQVLKKALLVLGKQKLTSDIYFKIAELLRSENRFISNSVKMFLQNENIKEPQILTLLKEE
ncbi:hypothetical protein EHW67_01370 [Arenibacter aquaticus]|uniref:Uncharacterized protein n=1 Tax=Arenibacter aquaticus TaxID=2489054 RepID=A0A3S0CN86_9FLAO|nr:hypothetical protein [Arenibacter aquaticus]RTE55243.1 hypothetical protein EHW67_01370 [Arenibacter aquaticus]